MKKKIVIVGPIADVGGREVEVNFIAKSLASNYDVKILSTAYITSESVALNDLTGVRWTSLQKKLYSKNLIIKFLSNLYKIYTSGKEKSYKYTNNSIVKIFFDLDRIHLDILELELSNIDLVILPTQLTTKFLPEIIDICNSNKIKCLVRTTGTIKSIDDNNFDFLKKVDLFVHHSSANAENLNKQIDLPYELVDQCTLNEESLLDISLSKNKPLTFGFIGRLSKEKGIIPLVNYFREKKYQFIVVGDGPQKEDFLKRIDGKSQINYIGLLSSNAISDFFKQIDVLIIPSFEESGPLVGIEAMAAGKIIISTDVGAMKTRLNDTYNSFWFDINNIETLDKIITEIKNKDDEKLIQVADSVRKEYVVNYSNQNIKSKYQEVIKKLLDAH